jgi:hypothetical protein
MRRILQAWDVDPVVIPNGLSPEAFAIPTDDAVAEIRQRFAGRPLLAKVARFDPDKRCLLALGITGELKRRGERPLLIARGGVEPHGGDVMRAAAEAGLRVVETTTQRPGAAGLLDTLRGADRARASRAAATPVRDRREPSRRDEHLPAAADRLGLGDRSLDLVQAEPLARRRL